MADAIRRSEMLQDKANRAEIHTQSVAATAETQMYRLQTELQTQRDEHRSAQQESHALRSSKSDIEQRLALMSTDVSTLRDSLQRKNHEMSANHSKFNEATQQFDIENQRRLSKSEYNISQLEDQIRSEYEFQRRSNLESQMEVRKYRDEASQREAEVRTIHGEFVSQGGISQRQAA
jgi:predicted nuclease with TOPRIM domain